MCPTGRSIGSRGESNFGSDPISSGVSETKSQWFLPSFQRVFQSEGQRQGQRDAHRKIHRVSSVAEAVISGDSVLNDSRKDLAKEVKMDLARFIWELHGVSVLNCLRQLCFKLMLSWIVVRQKQLVSRQCRFWWM